MTDVDPGDVGSTEVDAHVGARLRARRIFMKLSQEKIGELLGVTFQQIQKYEKGTNRIGAGQLFYLAKILGVELSFFYDGLTSRLRSGFAESKTDALVDEPIASDGAALHRAFSRIRNPKMRKRIIALVATIADAGAETQVKHRS